MFAMKSMGDSLLKLKLDMVYRDLSVEEAEKRYAELTLVPLQPPAEKVRAKRKVIKALVPTK
jgi:hypothetical protein